VGQAQRVGDAEGPVVAVAQVADVQAVFVGEVGGAGDVEDVVHGGAAGGDERLEPVDYAPCVQLKQSQVGCAPRGPGQRGDLVRGQNMVFVEHPGQPAVARGEV
jgi:hypothetical protein